MQEVSQPNPLIHFIINGQTACHKRFVYLTVRKGGRTSFLICLCVSKLYYFFLNAAYINFVLLILIVCKFVCVI